MLIWAQNDSIMKRKGLKTKSNIFLKSLFQSVVIYERMNNDLCTVKTQHPLYTHTLNT
jgi:hypothetical protein